MPCGAFDFNISPEEEREGEEGSPVIIEHHIVCLWIIIIGQWGGGIICFNSWLTYLERTNNPQLQCPSLAAGRLRHPPYETHHKAEDVFREIPAQVLITRLTAIVLSPIHPPITLRCGIFRKFLSLCRAWDKQHLDGGGTIGELNVSPFA